MIALPCSYRRLTGAGGATGSGGPACRLKGACVGRWIPDPAHWLRLCSAKFIRGSLRLGKLRLRLPRWVIYVLMSKTLYGSLDSVFCFDTFIDPFYLEIQNMITGLAFAFYCKVKPEYGTRAQRDAAVGGELTRKLYTSAFSVREHHEIEPAWNAQRLGRLACSAPYVDECLTSFFRRGL